MFETLIYSIISVAIAEMGDKTQLMCLALSSKYKKPFVLSCGLFAGALITYSVGGLIGHYLHSFLGNNVHLINIICALMFVLLGVIGLFEKHDDDEISDESKVKKSIISIFFKTAFLVIISEIGDKSMLASIALSAKFDSAFVVALGSSIGLMVANVPVLYFGYKILSKFSKEKISKFGSILFVITGFVMLILSYI